MATADIDTRYEVSDMNGMFGEYKDYMSALMAANKLQSYSEDVRVVEVTRRKVDWEALMEG